MTNIGHHAALIYTMVLVSAADRDMPDVELEEMGEIVGHLPVFRDFDKHDILKTANACVEMLKAADGLSTILKKIKAGLPEQLRETAYALACDIAAADGKVTVEESRFLEMLRYELSLGKLVCAAIERGARARHMTI
jgi:tellurite resistance protein